MACTLAASMSAAARARMLGQLGLEAGLLVRLQGVGRLAGLLDDAAGLGLGVGELGPVPVEHADGLGLGVLGRVEVAADALGASVHALLDGRVGELPHEEEQER